MENRSEDVLAGGGELGERMRGMDWSATALGPVSGWSQSLRSALSICIGSRFPIAIYWGSDLTLLYNDAWSPILGEKHPWALGRSGREVWPEIWDAIGPLFQQVLATGEATYSEDSLLPMRRHGYTEECYFNFTFSPIRGEGGRVDGIFNAVIETTYRVLNERRLRLLRKLGDSLALATTSDDVARLALRAFEDGAADVPYSALYLVDDGAGFARLAACSGLEAGGPAAPLVIALDSEASSGNWPLVRAQRSLQVEEVTDLMQRFGIALPSGPWPELATSALLAPIVLPSREQPIGFLILGVSPRRAVDEQYTDFAKQAAFQIGASFATVRRSDELAAIDRAKTAFFSNVSHEFRTPLTLMLAPIEDLRATALSDEDRERVDLLHRNALRLSKLVNNLLDFSRLEAGRVRPAFEPTDLSAATADIASTFRSAIERAGLTLSVDCPPLAEPLFVDRGLWEKVVLNLLSNAFKHTFSGSISVRTSMSERRAELEISDSGIGIAAREIPHLFERFHRVEGARSRSHEGSGIGLALVGELVRLHGGEVLVDSREGVGSTFRVSIPTGSGHLPLDRIARAPSSPPPPGSAAAYVQEAMGWSGSAEPESATQSRVAKSAPPGQRARIVVADDNADMRAYLSRLLGEQWDVEAVADGLAALTAIQRTKPDLIVSDVMMPGLDGFGLLRAVRDDASLGSIPFVLLSARAGAEAAAEGLQAGADDYIVKPFTARDLLGRVMARLAAAQSARATEKQRQNLYRNFMQAPFSVAVLRGPEHVIELANDAIVEQWGKRANVLGLPIRDALPELEGQPYLALLDEVYRSGVSHRGRGEVARMASGPSGALQDRYYNFVYSPLLDDVGGVDGVMVCAFEVTDQVNAREKIAQSKAKAETLASELLLVSQRLQAAQNVAQIGIFDWDLRSQRVHWSKELYALLGLTPDSIEASADAWTERLYEEDRVSGWKALELATEAHHDRFEVEVRLKQPGGGTRWVRISSLIAYDENGASLRLLGAVVDVDALKQFATEAVAARRELERTARARDEFVATMSHELRTPLNALLGWSKLLNNDHRDPAMLQRGLAVIERNALTQVRLVDDLMDVSRIISGRLRLQTKKTHIAAVIQAAADVVRPAADAKRVDLVLELDAAVGAAVVDPDRLQQIVWNLLSNAVRFTPAEGRVTVSAKRLASAITICVQDTGIGIAAEHLGRIFERFSQIDSSTTRKHGGLGLGLAIVRHLVEAHGGTIRVASDGLGTGSTFTATLPITAVDLSAMETSDSRRPSDPDGNRTTPTSAVTLQDVRVLVVEDDKDSLELLRMLLERAGARVTAASSALEALAAGDGFNVIISDIGMPEMDGYAFIQQIRARSTLSRIPAIALTAYARSEDADKARQAGFQEHLAKPVDADELLRLVKAVAGESSPPLN